MTGISLSWLTIPILDQSIVYGHVILENIDLSSTTNNKPVVSIERSSKKDNGDIVYAVVVSQHSTSGSDTLEAIHLQRSFSPQDWDELLFLPSESDLATYLLTKMFVRETLSDGTRIVDWFLIGKKA